MIDPKLVEGIVEAVEFMNLPVDSLVERGSRRSGNWAHRGRPGKKGGSLPGGGHKPIGIRPGDGKGRGDIVRASKEKRAKVGAIVSSLAGLSATSQSSGKKIPIMDFSPAEFTNIALNTLGQSVPASMTGLKEPATFDHLSLQALTNVYAKNAMKQSGNPEAIVLPSVLGKAAPQLSPTTSFAGKRGKIQVDPIDPNASPMEAVTSNLTQTAKAKKEFREQMENAKNKSVFGGKNDSNKTPGPNSVSPKNKPKSEPTKPSPAPTVGGGTAPPPLATSYPDAKRVLPNEIAPDYEPHWVGSGNKDKEISAEAQAALGYYTGSGYGPMNRQLRGINPMQPAIKKMIDDIDVAMDKTSLNQDIKAWRGTEFSVYANQLGSDPSQWIGKTFTDLGYSSHSIDPAKSFPGVKMETYIPKGTKGFYVGGMPGTQFSSEDEFLPQRGTRFRILDVQTSGNWVTGITTEIVSQGNDTV
jgi:hypothetical protein